MNKRKGIAYNDCKNEMDILYYRFYYRTGLMKKLLCLALLLVVTGCNGCCTKTVHIFHDRDNPDDSVGIVVIPYPIPEPPVPMPEPNPYPEHLESDPWCLLDGKMRC